MKSRPHILNRHPHQHACVLAAVYCVCAAATMHILPDALGRHTHHQHSSSSTAAAGPGLSLKGRSSKAGMHAAGLHQRGQLLLVSLGMLLPLVLSAVFHHEHGH